MIPTLKLRPVATGLIVFAILFVGLSFLSRSLGHYRIPDSYEYLAVMIFGFFPWLVAGYVALSTSKGNPIVYGLLLGFATSLIQYAQCIVQLPAQLQACTITTWFEYLAYDSFLCGLGGLLYYAKEILKQRFQRSK